MLLPPLSMCKVAADSPSDAVSMWDIINLSADSHPVHFHNVDFEVCKACGCTCIYSMSCCISGSRGKVCVCACAGGHAELNVHALLSLADVNEHPDIPAPTHQLIWEPLAWPLQVTSAPCHTVVLLTSNPACLCGSADVHHICPVLLPANRNPPHLLHPMQYLGRFALLLDPENPRTYTKTSTPVPNADLDPLLVVPCPVTLNPTGKCPVRKDTQLVLPATYTRIAFHAPARSGLYVWHW
jgi:FtsP/CotA-like multicopper oxidase with cupredoxin domain